MKRLMVRKYSAYFFCLVLLLPLVVGSRAGAQSKTVPPFIPKYIFLFLADGAGITHLEVARLHSLQVRKEGLWILDRIAKEGFFGLLTTHSADSLITDSAAAATAMACGCKAKNRTVGLCADTERIPATAFEMAKEKGKRLALVTNSTIYDATPAAFAAHAENRRMTASILEAYLKLEPEIVLGGGREYFLPRGSSGGRRKDDQDTIARWRAKGYLYVSNRKELKEAKPTKLLGLFSLGSMPLETERDRETEPSVYDMTRAAIRIFSQNLSRGFIALIESEHVDTAAHGGKIVPVVKELVEFDRAVKAAYDFYQRHPQETLIIVTSDHETGGLTLVRKKRNLIRGFSDPSVSDLLGPEMASDAEIRWSTSGHSGQPVFVFALGPGAERFRGYQDNTDFGKHLLALLSNSSSP